MELFERLNIGEYVEIVTHRSDMREKPQFRSRIEDIYKQNLLLVPVPPEKGAMSVIGRADALELVALKGSAKIIFKAIISEKLKMNNSLYYVVRLTDVGKRIQDRSFFRADVMMDVKFTVKGQLMTGITKNVSGGGMQILSKGVCEAGDMMTMTLDLNNDKVFVIGKVISFDSLPEDNFRYRIRFIEMNEKEQDKIIRFVLDVQRKEAMRVNVSVL